MKLGIFNLVLIDKKLEEALDIVNSWGLDAIEFSSGGFLPKNHVNPSELLIDDKKRKNLINAVEKRGLIISALSCHGNIVHPQKDFADKHRKDLRDTIQLAGKIGVERICMLSGCPGASEKDQTPNFISCPWPEYFSESSKWQWEKRIIPAWKEEAAFAKKHGVKMIAFEMVPGDAVYNPETLLRLREAAGDVIGCNFDPSHLFWQGIDPIAALRALKDCIYHVHAKDSRVDPLVAQVNGILDPKPHQEEMNRSWIFRTVGYGHGSDFWTDFVSTLRLIGYDYVLSIEHEDSLMSGEEGIEKAITFLRNVLIEKPRGEVWWDLDL